MNTLLSYIHIDIIFNNQMKCLKENKDPFYQEPLRQAHTKLVQERAFLEGKMRGNTYIPRDTSTIEESKSEILTEIQKSLGHQFKQGRHWDDVFKQPETKRWLDLYERASKNEFTAVKDAPTQVDNVLGREIPVEYGPARDLDMLQDFLNNFMNDPDAIRICQFVFEYFFT